MSQTEDAIHKLKGDKQEELKQLAESLQQKESANQQLLKERAAAACTLANANQLVIRLTENLQKEETQKFELHEKLVATEEKLRLSSVAAPTQAPVHGIPPPVQTAVFLNPVAATQGHQPQPRRGSRNGSITRVNNSKQPNKFRQGA